MVGDWVEAQWPPEAEDFEANWSTDELSNDALQFYAAKVTLSLSFSALILAPFPLFVAYLSLIFARFS